MGVCTAYFLLASPSYNASLHSVILIEEYEVAGAASGKAGRLPTME